MKIRACKNNFTNANVNRNTKKEIMISRLEFSIDIKAEKPRFGNSNESSIANGLVFEGFHAGQTTRSVKAFLGQIKVVSIVLSKNSYKTIQFKYITY
jgi:hypothetical protein